MSSLAELMFLQQQAQPQAQGPIQRGAQAGIDAAQQTIAMSDIQRRRAQGAAMMEMAQHMFSPDYGHGFKGMMAGINAGIPHATNAYLGTEDKLRSENMAMLGRQDKLEEQALRHAMQKQKMKETERYHNALLADRAKRTGMMKDKLGNQNYAAAYEGLDLSQFPDIQDKPTLTKLNGTSRGLARAEELLKAMEKDLNALNEATKGDAFASIGSTFGESPNMVKDIYANATGNKNLQHVRNLRNRLNTKSNELQPILENALQPGKAAGESMLKHFRESRVYPSNKDTIPEYIDKVNQMNKKIKHDKKMIDLSIKTKKIISGLPMEESTSQNDVVSEFKQRHPKYADVPADKILEAIQKIEAGGGTWK